MSSSFTNEYLARIEKEIAHRPEYIYKYVSLGGELDTVKIQTLLRDELYFARKNDFDDSQEYRNLIYESTDDPVLKSILKPYIYDRICCFCGSEAISPLMWIHYANCYNGFRLKFEVVKDLHILNKIIYLDKFFHIKPAKSPDDTSTFTHNKKVMASFPYIKKERWSGQDEYRIILSGNNYIERLSDTQYIPYNQCGLKLVEITVGEHCIPANFKELKAYSEKKRVPLYIEHVPRLISLMYLDYCERYNFSENEALFLKSLLLGPNSKNGQLVKI